MKPKNRLRVNPYVAVALVGLLLLLGAGHGWARQQAWGAGRLHVEVTTTTTTAVVGRGPGSKEWYAAALRAWDAKEASESAVLGEDNFSGQAVNFGPRDINSSEAFLLRAFGPALKEAAEGRRRLVALDCAAGIGRVSEHLLLRYFNEVDLVEQSGKMLGEARRRLGGSKGRRFLGGHRAVNFYQEGLQDFTPRPGRFDVVWLQWALMYLPDEDAAALLQRCVRSLKPGGRIFVKDNISDEGREMDTTAAAIYRSTQDYVDLFDRGGARVVDREVQDDGDLSADQFPVMMWALEPSQ